jgi:hypothetical protein
MKPMDERMKPFDETHGLDYLMKSMDEINHIDVIDHVHWNSTICEKHYFQP